MGIEDIQISEELETNAPSIKYSGNEGPKSPQEMEQMMMAQLEEEYSKYVNDMLEQGIEPMSLEQFLDQAMAEGQMSRGPVLPSDEDPINPFQPKPQGPVLPDRQMAAYGGIMGVDGRRQYGFGSSLKKRIRKIIPNEIAKTAEVAAPFVAPFNPLAAGLMSGIGGFDRTGRIGSSLKSGLMNYGMGQIARGLGGAGMQEGFNLKINPNATGLGQYFSSPMAAKTAVAQGVSGSDKALFTSDKAMRPDLGLMEVPGKGVESVVNLSQGQGIDKISPLKQLGNKIMEYVPTSLGDVNPFGENFDLKKAGGAFLLFKGVEKLSNMAPQETVSAIMDRGENLDLEGIRTEVIEAYRDPSGEKLKALAIKYPYAHQNADVVNVAQGGRIGFNNGGGADMGDPQMGGTDYVQTVMESLYQQNQDKYQSPDDPQLVQDALMMVQKSMAPFKLSESRMKNNLSRINRAEGGIMDLGGMEKDYRAEGGFVPIGREEKADDVPARLSVNEFVFTADAVRNAGGGDIDKGAEVMENMMKNLEAGGQVSEESQGMAGAQQMFETSQRLSEVI